MEEAVRDRVITRRNPIAIGYRDYINRTENVGNFETDILYLN